MPFHDSHAACCPRSRVCFTLCTIVRTHPRLHPPCTSLSRRARALGGRKKMPCVLISLIASIWTPAHSASLLSPFLHLPSPRLHTTPHSPSIDLSAHSLPYCPALSHTRPQSQTPSIKYRPPTSPSIYQCAMLRAALKIFGTRASALLSSLPPIRRSSSRLPTPPLDITTGLLRLALRSVQPPPIALPCTHLVPFRYISRMYAYCTIVLPGAIESVPHLEEEYTPF